MEDEVTHNISTFLPPEEEDLIPKMAQLIKMELKFCEEGS